MGICHGTPACNTARAEKRRRAKGIKPRGTNKAPCIVEGCPGFNASHGYCQTHYMRVRLHGEPGPAELIRKRAQIKAGDQFGSWTALADYKRDLVRSRCTCGIERLMSPRVLKQLAEEGECRCETRLGRPPGRDPEERPVKDAYITEGQAFGLLTALETVGRSTDHVRCRCECGKETETPLANNLRLGKTRSCGCRALSSQYKHGLCKHPLYQHLALMIRRCTDPHDKSYPDYGGRGNHRA